MTRPRKHSAKSGSHHPKVETFDQNLPQDARKSRHMGRAPCAGVSSPDDLLCKPQPIRTSPALTKGYGLHVWCCRASRSVCSAAVTCLSISYKARSLLHDDNWRPLGWRRDVVPPRSTLGGTRASGCPLPMPDLAASHLRRRWRRWVLSMGWLDLEFDAKQSSR